MTESGQPLSDLVDTNNPQSMSGPHRGSPDIKIIVPHPDGIFPEGF